MKERLIILSDLWGKEKSNWLNNYTHVLDSKFDIYIYDSCILGEINKADCDQESLHNQFVAGGIERAVENLIRLEKISVKILAFSIGGVIAWKFGLKTNAIKSLTCVSSTRLRKEMKRPEGKIDLYFGENDEYRPNLEWCKSMKLELNVLSSKGHLVYTEPEFAIRLSGKLLS